ncbi:MAG: hypothetical protein MUO26_10515 [Methanotrichaceae archaeon]|nr:hypothetical protein [Methanotrichaceae archaeon]
MTDSKDLTLLELEELIKSAQKQPGIVELMHIYGQYAELLEISNEYLAELKPRNINFSASNST